MRKKLLLTVALVFTYLFINAQDTVGVNFINSPLADLQVKAQNSGRLVFIDCYTSWCGPCKKMSKEVFTQKSVGDFFSSRFVSTKIDMEKGEGVALNKKWDIGAYPTFIVLNGDGEIKFRLTGYFSPTQLTDTLQSLMNNRKESANTIKYKSGDRTPSVVIDYINELQERYEKNHMQEVANEFCNSHKESLLKDTLAYSIFHKYMKDPYQKAFLYAYSNREKFANKYGKSSVDEMEYVWRSYAKNFYIMDETSRDLKGYKIAEMDNYERFMIQNGVTKAKEYTMYYKLPASFIIKDKNLLIKNLFEAAKMPDISQGQFEYGCNVLSKIAENEDDLKKLSEIKKSRTKYIKE